MIKWWKARSRQEKWMAVIIAMLLVGIIIRWEYVSREAGDAFRWRFSKERVESDKQGRTAPPLDNGDPESEDTPTPPADL